MLKVRVGTIISADPRFYDVCKDGGETWTLSPRAFQMDTRKWLGRFLES